MDIQHFSPSIAAKTSTYFNTINDYYVQQYLTVDNKEDQLVQSLSSTDALKTAFDKQKDDYQNDNLADLVSNHNDFTRIIEVDHELIQRADPVYLDPIRSSMFGNAQFYAPNKRIFGQLFDTFWVNLGIIWGMTALLSITLYFDSLKKLLVMFSRIKLPSFKKSKSAAKS